MKFDAETVKKVAHLARLDLTAEETNRYADQLSKILGYIDQLNAYDTKNVEPLAQVQEYATPLREDVVKPGPGAEAMLACAPESVFENFKVPQVMASKDGGGE